MINRSLEVFHARDMGYFRLPTSPNRGDYTFKPSIRSIVDNPEAMFIFIHLVDLGVELGPCVQVISLPELSDLANDLLTVGISAFPLHRRMEAVHERVDLKTRGVINPLIPPIHQEEVNRMTTEEGTGCQKLTVQIPPRLSDDSASNMATSNPWPMQ